MQLIVLGMHRSGTSSVTRLLSMAGAYFGAPEMATKANAENPKGFWERRDVRAVCDGLLHAGGFDWHRVSGFEPDAIPTEAVDEQRRAFASILDELDANRPWVVKEPRLCLLLPLLRPLLTAPVCIHVTREPLEVAQSVHVRNQIPRQGALALWELYTLHAARASSHVPHVHVRYEDLVDDPMATTSRLVADLAALGVDGLVVPPTSEVTDFISPALHRQREGSGARSGRLTPQQISLAERADDGSLFQPGALVPELSPAGAEELEVLERIFGAEEAELTARAEARDQDALRRQVEITALEALDKVQHKVEAMGATRAWRLGGYVTAMRRTLVPGLSRTDPTPFSNALATVERGRRNLRSAAGRPGDDVDGDPRRVRPVDITASRPRTSDHRRRVAVVAWDVGHNPLGRANVLAEVLGSHFDVEMWGAQFDRYGFRVWSPLRDAPVPVLSFAGHPFPQHQAVVEAVSEVIDADAIWVSKPRLPSFLVGALAKEKRGVPLVLDVDDHELAFFDEDRGIDIESLGRGDHGNDLLWPFERAWTRACDPLIGFADQVTVSNAALQQRYGGLIVPHARDAALFDPDRFDRDEVRQRLGIDPDDRLLVFGGTPRIHKGVVEVLRALEEIDDPRMKLLVFGTREFDDLRPHIGSLERWVRAVPYLPFHELPSVLAAADLSCILQDPDHAVSRYQMPAKVTDALAMGVPCLVSRTPPMQELIEAGVVRAVGPGEPLADAIRHSFSARDETADRAARGRALFLERYSYEAVAAQVVPLFQDLIADPPEFPAGLRPLVDVPRSLYGRSTGPVEATIKTGTSRILRRPPRSSRPFEPGDVFDLVVFWKQNDTGIYGRRQDKVLEHLVGSGRVGTALHFDNPITPEALAHMWRRGRAGSDQGPLVARQTIRRLVPATRRTGDLHHHTFIHAGARTARLGMPARDHYGTFVARVLAEHGVGRDRPVVLWGYPTNADLPELIDQIGADLVVSDVVDDNRTWFAPGSPEYDKAEQNYDQVLRRSHVVFANCQPVANAMSRFTPEVTVVPNGLDLPAPDRRPSDVPADLATIGGPVIGYVGNLSSRLDLALVEAIADARPRWQFVFIGSAHLDRSVLDLGRRPNVHFLGVKPHHEVAQYLDHFDVAIIPHLDNEMTQAMNPLKAFVYAAAGVPVVSTPIPNLGHLGTVMTIARSAEGFLEAIQAHLDHPPAPLSRDDLAPHSWTERVRSMLDAIDEVLAG